MCAPPQLIVYPCDACGTFICCAFPGGGVQEHLQELAAREEEKRAAFMAQMGLKAGQKITIQPRRDG